MRRLLSLFVLIIPLALPAAENWQDALGRMPLAATNITRLDKGNCVAVMLKAFKSNDVVKALVFMPGATDEFYMFRRAQAVLTNNSPTLLDAVTALTNQTQIRATFLPPLLLLHTDEDPIEPIIRVEDEATAAKVRQATFAHNGFYNDTDWDHLLPVLRKSFHTSFLPKYKSATSWHFFRHSFASWNLTGWEALEAISLAGKETVLVQHKKMVFEGDTRTRARPKLDSVVK